MNSKLVSVLKIVVPLSFGIFLIFWFYRSLSQPDELVIPESFEGRDNIELTWLVNDSAAVVLEDTLCVIESNGNIEYITPEIAGWIKIEDAPSNLKAGSIIGFYHKDVFGTIKSAFGSANYFWVLISALCGLLAHISRAFRWRMLLRPMGYKPRLSTTFFAICVMYIVNIAIMRVGEVFRCSVMARYEKIPVEKSLGTMVTERAFDLLCLLIMGVIAAIFEYDVMLKYLTETFANMSSSGDNSKLYIMGAIALVGMIVLIVLFVVMKKNNHPLLLKVKNLIKGMFDGVISIVKLKNPLAFIAHTIFIWVMYVMILYFGFNAMAEVSHFGLSEALPVFFVGSLAIIIVQGGLGVYPIFVSKVLESYGISPTIGYSFGWIMWCGQNILILVIGSTAFAALSFVKEQNSAIDESTS